MTGPIGTLWRSKSDRKWLLSAVSVKSLLASPFAAGAKTHVRCHVLVHHGWLMTEM